MIRRMAAKSLGFPSRLTASTARVRGVIAAATGLEIEVEGVPVDIDELEPDPCWVTG
jgi:hypothetical protein